MFVSMDDFKAQRSDVNSQSLIGVQFVELVIRLNEMISCYIL